jgi:hypothetical protein
MLCRNYLLEIFVLFVTETPDWVASRQVVDFDHRHPHSRDRFQEFPRRLTSQRLIEMSHRSRAEVPALGRDR